MFPTKQHHIVSTCFVISIRRRSTPRGFPLCLPLPTRWTPLHPMASKLSFPTSAPLPCALPTAGQPPWKSKTAKQLFCCFPTSPPLRWSISGKNRRTTAALPRKNGLSRASAWWRAEASFYQATVSFVQKPALGQFDPHFQVGSSMEIITFSACQCILTS